MVGVAGPVLLCSRSCCRHAFLSFTFHLVSWSLQSVHKYIIIVSIIGSGWKCGVRFIGAMRRVWAVSCEGSAFLGPSGALFWFLFSCSSLSSTSANPIGRVHDQDRRELSGCSCSLLLLPLEGVTCMAGIVVVDPKDSEGWGLHSGVLSLLITFVVLLK